MIDKIPGLSYVVPNGAFYVFPDVSNLLTKSYAGQRLENVDMLAEMLLEHAHIAVVPGSAFGSERHVRLSYAIPTADITAGLKNLDAFVKALT